MKLHNRSLFASHLSSLDSRRFFFQNLLWEEHFNSDGQQFNKYQQNKQWPLSSSQRTLKSTTLYMVRNQGLGFGQAHQCGRINPVNGIPIYAFQLNKSVLS